MTTPPPRQVYADLREAETFVHHDKRTCGTRDPRGRVVGCLACEYQWAHGAAYERSVGDDAKVRVSGADPVGGLVVSKDHMRRDVNRAASEIQRALRALRNAEGALIAALDKAGRPSSTTAVWDPAKGASRKDLREAALAQARRRAAGEGIA